jgi:hypothetical protein
LPIPNKLYHLQDCIYFQHVGQLPLCQFGLQDTSLPLLLNVTVFDLPSISKCSASKWPSVLGCFPNNVVSQDRCRELLQLSHIWQNLRHRKWVRWGHLPKPTPAAGPASHQAATTGTAAGNNLNLEPNMTPAAAVNNETLSDVPIGLQMPTPEGGPGSLAFFCDMSTAWDKPS